MNCKKCKELGNQVMDLFIENGYTLDEARIVLLEVLGAIEHTISQRGGIQ